MKRYIRMLLLLPILFGSSCVSLKKTVYFQDTDNSIITKEIQATHLVQSKIQQRDYLFIRVLSFDEQTYSFFNLESKSGMMSSDLLTLYSYKVKENGCIDFPFVGEIMVEGLTLTESKIKIEEALSDYLVEVSVIVKYVSNSISILGEVQRPGNYPLNKDQITIYQALGLAGDATMFGDKRKITVVREADGITTFNYLDITKKNVVGNSHYFIKPNDIIYVEPINVKQFGFVTFPYGLLLTTASTIFTIIALTK